MTLVLRKSYGPYSAGTTLEMISAAEARNFPTGTVNPGYSTVRMYDGKVIDIEYDLVVKLRPRTRLQTQSEKRIWGKLYGDRN